MELCVKMKNKKYYKVVTEDLFSCIMSITRTPNKLSVQYKINDWVKPKIKNTPLFIFDNLPDAIFFYEQESSCNKYLSIYTCQCKNPHEIDIPNLISTIHKNVPDQWCWLDDVPSGTVGCDEVKLIKRIVHE